MADPITDALKTGGKTAPVLRRTLLDLYELSERLESRALAARSNSDPRRAAAYGQSAADIREVLTRHLLD